jgi:hypothetical protein
MKKISIYLSKVAEIRREKQVKRRDKCLLQSSNQKRKLLSEEILCLEKMHRERQSWIAFYATHSGDKMSLQKTTFSYGWMSVANACLHTTRIAYQTI